MAYSNIDISLFYDLFQGNTKAFGVTEVGEIVDGKAKSKSKLVYDAVTPAVIQRHLEGTLSIGIAPIRDDSTCMFGAIDIDDYKYNLIDVVNAIEDFNLPLCPCYSKSKKLHIYIFFAEDTKAEDVRDILQWYASAFSCSKKVEIFPKQSSAKDTNTFYSWINLPYFNASDDNNHRKMVTKNGKLLPLADALSVMKSRKLTLAEHKQRIQDLPFHDAPPCILSGMLLRDIGPGQRNNWLFSCGVYFRLKDENCDLNTLLTEVNHSLQEPIPDAELQATVLKGFQRKSYFYMCAALERCDKTNCRKQEFGIESKASTGLEYGELTQYLTEPPYYTWIVNGQKLLFNSEAEILQQNKFRALCLRQLHLVPRRVEEDRWSKILTRACENIVVIEPQTLAGDFTSGSTFFDLTCAFFNTRRRADNITQLAMGRIFYDNTEKEYVFTARSFLDFLINKNNFKDYTNVEIRNKLQDLGAYKNGSVWRISENAFPKPEDVKIDIDFRDKETGSEDF